MKLISTVIITSLISLFSSVNAQDIIIFKTGDELKAKVSEVGTTEIKYKKFDNLNGPVYTTNKAELFIIKYENGSKDVFNSTSLLTPAPNSDTRTDYDKNMHLYKKKLAGGIIMTAIGAPVLLSGLALSGAGLSSLDNGDEFNGNRDNFPGGVPMLMTGGLFLAAGVALVVIGPIKISSAKKYKRKALESKATMSFNPIVGPSNNFGQAMTVRTGAGLRINF